MKCVVAWLDAQTGIYSFVWQPAHAAPAVDAAAGSVAQLFSLAGELSEQVLTDTRFKPHPSFTQAMQGTSVPAMLVTLENLPRPMIDRNLLSCLFGADALAAEFGIGPFALAARALGAGSDRRILQMAIQYLANGGVEDSLTAAEYDWNFIQEIKRDLLKQK
jgi:hypothetical protein